MKNPRFMKRPDGDRMAGIDRMNLENTGQLQNYIRSQIYVMGYVIGVNAGANPNAGPINLGGAARFMYGFNLYIGTPADFDTFSLTINNEVIFNSALWFTVNPTNNPRGREMYFKIPRPLSGSDSVQFAYTAANAKNVYPQFYLSNVAQNIPAQ